MSVIQTIYNPIINLLYKATSFLSVKLRDVLLTITLVLLELYYLSEYSLLNRFTFASLTSKGVATLVMIFLVLLFSINAPVKRVKINVPLEIAFLVYVATIFIAACIHPLREGYVLFAVTLLLMPAFYIVWGNRGDYSHLFEKIAKIWTITGLEYLILCMVLMPPDNYHYYLGRYCGLTSNPNVLGMVTVSVVACSLYLIMIRKLQVVAVFAAAMSIALVWVSGSRTATLSIVLMIVAFLIMVFRKRDPLQKSVSASIACLILILALGACGAATAEMPAEKWGYYGVEEVRVLTDAVTKFTDEELQELGEETPTGEVHLKDILLSFLGSTVYADTETESKDAVDTEGVNDGGTVGGRMTGSDPQYDFSNGRLGTYQQIIDQINLEGHDPNVTYLYYNEQRQIGAHNTPLEFTFECGIICGIACLLIELMAALYVIIQLFGKKEAIPGTLFAVLIMVGYGIESMLEMQVVFGNRDLVLLFYIVLSVIFVKEQGQNKDAE